MRVIKTEAMPNDVSLAAVYLRLALIGLSVPLPSEDEGSAQLVAPILARQRELSRQLSDGYCAADQRIQNFLDDYLADVYPVEAGVADDRPQLPRRTLVLDEAGLARTLSLPVNGDAFASPLLSSYRLANGVLHNPANDRRTTAGVFHIAEGGLPIPDEKIAVPKAVFGRLLALAFQPPAVDLVLPYLSQTDHPAACFVSLLLRPLVSPAVPGYATERRMETRFIVPGGLVANLDFVEGIFGNAGDPYLPEHDASLDPGTWTGTTGCVILAPHLIRVKKKDLGLPHIDSATERQKRDGVCWSEPDELYNGGQAFKICARDARGVMVTVIADNYFGYCKKEVKTQISYTANLFGNVEEEHAGGALVFPSYNIGAGYTDESAGDDYRLEDVLARDATTVRPAARGTCDRHRTAAPGAGAVPAHLFVAHDDRVVVDARRRAVDPAARRQGLPGSQRLPRAVGPVTVRPPALGPEGDRPDGHVLPQAQHRLRRRQVRDLEGDHRCLHLR